MLKCPHCPREFGDGQGLSIHIGKMHKEYLLPPIVLPVKCTHCDELIAIQGCQKDSLYMGTVDGEKLPFHRECYMSVHSPSKRSEVAAKISKALTGKPKPWLVGDKNPSRRSEVAANISKALKSKPHPWMMGDKNVMHRPEVKVLFMGDKNPMRRPEVADKIKGDKNPMRKPENFERWRKAMSMRPNKTEARLIPILGELGFTYHKKIEIRRAPDFVHESERRVIEYDGFAGHNPGHPWTPNTWKECLAIDGERDLNYLDADYEVLRIFPEDLAEGDDFVRAKVEEWMVGCL